MFTQKLRGVLHAIFAGSLLLALCQNAIAQNQSQAAGKTSAKKTASSAESCDGALDIVPVKSMTFTRKRRPSKAEQPKPADTKSENQQEDKAKGGQ
ncbi:MAG: hypothetical protein AB7O81_31505 [Blastocatellales bacterium]